MYWIFNCHYSLWTSYSLRIHTAENLVTVRNIRKYLYFILSLVYSRELILVFLYINNKMAIKHYCDLSVSENLNIYIYVLKFVINKRKLIWLLVYIDKFLNQNISIVEMVFICRKLRIDFSMYQWIYTYTNYPFIQKRKGKY